MSQSAKSGYQVGTKSGMEMFKRLSTDSLFFIRKNNIGYYRKEVIDMIKNEIELEKDFNRCVELITKIEKLEEIYKGYVAIIEDHHKQGDELLWKYNYFRGKDINIDEIREDFAECFNDLIIDYVNEEDKKNSGE